MRALDRAARLPPASSACPSSGSPPRQARRPGAVADARGCAARVHVAERPLGRRRARCTPRCSPPPRRPASTSSGRGSRRWSSTDGRATGLRLADGARAGRRHRRAGAGRLERQPARRARRCRSGRSRARSCGCAATPGCSTAPSGRWSAAGRSTWCPYGDDGLVVGATVEEQGFDAAVTAGAVLRPAARRHRGRARRRRARARRDAGPVAARARPTTRRCSARRALPGLVLATGHHRNGVLLTPVTADAIAELLAERRRCPGLRRGVRARTGSTEVTAMTADRQRRVRRASPTAATVAALVAARAPTSAAVAVARNGEVVPRSDWDDDALTDGDARRGPRRGGGRLTHRCDRRPADVMRPDETVRRPRLLLGTGGVPSLDVLERAIIASGTAAGHRRAAPGRGVHQRRAARRAGALRGPAAAQHRRLHHRPGGGAHRAAGPRGVRAPTGSSSR